MEFSEWIEKFDVTGIPEQEIKKYKTIALLAWIEKDLEYRNKLTSWMIANDLTTSHEDSFDDMLAKLQSQIDYLKLALAAAKMGNSY